MTGAALLHLIIYITLITFIVAVAIRFLKINTMPLHLRWELYPVGHESGEKAKYGGSYFENLDWWTKTPAKSRANELKAMIPEMLFLVALFEHNRKLWWRSFPFHFGLYILIGVMGLVVFGGLAELVGISVAPDSSVFGLLIYYSTMLAAVIGLTLATVGTLGLLQRRLFDPELKDYTTRSDIFNLVFFLVVLAVAWLTFAFVDTNFTLTRSFVQSLITFDISAPIGSGLLGLEVLLVGLLIAYIPMTHMSHFFVKWFTWHKVRWDDEPNTVGNPIEKKVMDQVQYPVTWAAPHINADGKKNWVDIATEEMK